MFRYIIPHSFIFSALLRLLRSLRGYEKPVATWFSETSVRTHRTTRCQKEPSSACSSPLSKHTNWRGWPLGFQQQNKKHYATFRVETQVNLASQSEGNTAVDTGKRRCKASYTTTWRLTEKKLWHQFTEHAKTLTSTAERRLVNFHTNRNSELVGLPEETACRFLWTM